jgi:hypothetical protein
LWLVAQDDVERCVRPRAGHADALTCTAAGQTQTDKARSRAPVSNILGRFLTDFTFLLLGMRSLGHEPGHAPLDAGMGRGAGVRLAGL